MEKLTWKAEVEFTGTIREFNKFADAMNGFSENMKVVLPIQWPHPIPFPGIWPMDFWLDKLHIRERFANEELHEIRLIKDIYGGIRTPHLHLENKVMLLNQALFKDMIGDIVRDIVVSRIDRATDYIDVIQTIELLGDDPIPPMK